MYAKIVLYTREAFQEINSKIRFNKELNKGGSKLNISLNDPLHV